MTLEEAAKRLRHLAEVFAEEGQREREAACTLGASTIDLYQNEATREIIKAMITNIVSKLPHRAAAARRGNPASGRAICKRPKTRTDSSLP